MIQFILGFYKIVEQLSNQKCQENKKSKNYKIDFEKVLFTKFSFL